MPDSETEHHHQQQQHNLRHQLHLPMRLDIVRQDIVRQDNVREDNVLHLVSMHVSTLVFLSTLLYNLHVFSDQGMFIGGSIGPDHDDPIKFFHITFSMWFIVYTWLLFITVYYTASMCRMGVSGPLYLSPNLITPPLYALYIFINCLNITWLFVVIQQSHPSAGPVILGFISLLLYLCIGISMLRMFKESSILLQRPKEIWWIVMLVQNGLALYAGWTTILTSTTTAAILEKNVGVSRAHVQIATYYFIMAKIVAWFFCDVFILDISTRYLFTPYIIVCWATGGIVLKEWSEKEIVMNDPDISIVLMIVSSVIFFAKLVLVIYQHSKHESYVSELGNPRPTVLEKILGKC